MSSFLSENTEAEYTNRILEVTSASIDESGVCEPISLRNTFDSLTSAKQAQIIRIKSQPKRKKAFLQSIEPARVRY